MASLPASFAVGDPARPVIGRAVFRTLLAAAAFVLFGYGLKEIKPLYLHTPWMNDPYDTFVSFTIFFVPLVAGLSAVRIVLCRTSGPLPVQRVRDLLRGSRLVAGTVAVALLADWVSVVLRANRAHWNAVSGLEIGLLVVTSLLTARAALALRSASARMPADRAAAGAPPDWLGDLLLAAKVHSRLLGPWHAGADRLAGWADRHLVTLVRRRPLLIAAIGSAGFGLAFAGAQAFGEGIPPGQISAMYFIVSAGAMYAFMVTGGAYLGLVRAERPSTGLRRRLADTAAAACAALPIAIAFRYALWALAGSHSESLPHLWSLLLLSATAAAIVVFTLESLTHTHRAPATPIG